MDQPFRFKQFTVHQDKTAMKVGTDGVLLGAWASIAHQPQTILDIGTGTGLIALQLAQRSDATLIDAVEIDHDAYEQCVQNFEASPWADRLFCYHASIQEYASEMEEEYDLIASNPPFFSSGTISNDPARNQARFDDALPLEHLLVCSLHLLSGDGRLAIIIPEDRELELLELAKKHEVYLVRRCRVQGNPNAPFKRCLLEFSFFEKELLEETLCLRNSDGSFSSEYIELVNPFYLDLSAS
ncbi:tRNA1(Val) (adenine(37)-N6)-methyltransferase [Aureitalea marina]|uniref:tRNA1(Val) (adenine(37)-N6)-methyltransferase n=1 Tax=Aureitalea marina TaxID=930804 RepID=A0A2S7KT93_9FLAO|nr:methyltransferase [Aureitalea marina]PQB05849.1 tRNA (adenine-N(6)-)-methyltransferase [Aureitalea marina]